MNVPPIDAAGVNAAAFLAPDWATGLQAAGPENFASLLAHGLTGIEAKLKTANDLATQFAVDDSIPPHQVIIAMEEARMSMGMMLQVRSRLVQGLTQLMQMQL